jgi:hypothetical protein
MKNFTFTVEETNLICAAVAESREAVIAELAAFVPETGDAEDDAALRDIAESAIKKLKDMSDEEFAGMDLYPA